MLQVERMKHSVRSVQQLLNPRGKGNGHVAGCVPLGLDSIDARDDFHLLIDEIESGPNRQQILASDLPDRLRERALGFRG
jgi:hypothetical protein